MPKITQLYAFIAEDQGPDDEGVAAFFKDGQWFPLVGADMERVNSFRVMARLIANRTGKALHLVKFSQREELEVIKPPSGKENE